MSTALRLVLVFLASLVVTACDRKHSNDSPSLNKVPPSITVALGDRLAQSFQAADFDETPLEVELEPFPLPRNATYNAGTGLLLFTPDQQQVGIYKFIARANGKRRAVEQAFDVVVSRRSGPTEISGSVRDSDTDVPVVGAEIRIPNTSIVTRTDGEGRFRVSSIPPDAAVIEIDGAPANGWTYVAEGIDLLLGHTLFAEQNNIVFRPIYLPKLGPPAGVINPNQASTLQNPQVGAQLVVPANSARRDNQLFSGEMFMPEVRPDRTPAALPPETQPGLVVAIQPAGLRFNPPAQISLPNRENLEVGTQVDIWSIDPVSGMFADVGDAVVGADNVIRTVRGGVINSSWHFLLPGPGEGTGDTDDSDGENDDQQNQCSVSGSSMVRLRSGNLVEEHDIAPYQSLGVERTLKLVYNLKSADPRPIYNSDIFIPQNTAVPEVFSTRMTIGNVEQNFDMFTRATRDRIRIGCQVDATRWKTGWYPHEVRLTSIYPSSTRTARFFGGTLITNERDSTCGAGWSIDGIARIHPVPDRPFVALAEGDGSIKLFTPQTGTTSNAKTDLCFCIDGSGSISDDQWQLQIRGMAAAVEDPTVIPQNGTVRFAVVQYASGRAVEHIALTAIDSGNAGTLANRIRGLGQIRGGTPMAAGIDQSVTTLGQAPPDVRQVICVTTDGVPDDARAAVAAADRAIAQGIEEIDVVGIGQGVNLDAIRDVARNGVIVVVPSFAEFASTVGEKIRRVISGSPAGEFSTLRREPDNSYVRRFTDGVQHKFSDQGFLTSVIDRNGNTTVYEYDSRNRLSLIRDPVGLDTTFGYNPAGMLQSIRRPGNLVTTLEHDGRNLKRITDHQGKVRLFEYDANHRLIQQTDKRGQATNYEFDPLTTRIKSATHVSSGVVRQFKPSQIRAVLANPRSTSRSAPATPILAEGIVSEYTDGRGKVTKTQSDRLGRVKSHTDALNRTSLFVQNRNGLAERITHPNGRVDTFLYDEKGNILQKTEASNNTALRRTWTYTYHRDFGFVTSATDPDNRVTRWEYDSRSGNLLKVTNPAPSNTTKEYTYTAKGQVETAKDENGSVTRFAYDSQGRLETVTDALGYVARHTRDASGNVLSITDGFGLPEARVRSFTYDSENRVLSSSDAGGTTRFEYDNAGNLTRTTMPTGEVITREYDAMGRLAKILDPVRGATEFTYDSESNLGTRKDAFGRSTRFEYDDAGQLTKALDPQGGEEAYTYDRLGNVETFRNANLNTTRFGYDLLGRRTSRTYPETTPQQRVRTWGYDKRDNMTTDTQPGSVIIRHEYDELQRLKVTRVPAVGTAPANLVTYGYDNVGNVRTVTDNDTSLEWVYDALNRVREQRTLAGGTQPVVTIASGYNGVGDRTAVGDSLGGQWGYGFDGAGRMSAVRTPSNTVIGLGRDATGRLTSLAYPNGVVGSYSYQGGTGRLVNITHQRGTQMPVVSLDYGLNAVGNVASIQELGGAKNYGYDNLDRLTSAATPTVGESYSYDAVGNRLTSHLSTAHTTNRDNQLLQDQQFTYQYDLRGNLTSKTARPSGPATAYVWDAQNQLVEVRVGGGATVRFKYDGLGRKVERDAGSGNVVRYIYDGDHVALVVAGSTVARMTYGDQVDQVLSSTIGGDARYYHADHLGSVRSITRADGSEEVRYDYDSYGQLRIVSGNGSTPNPFFYTGREWDSDVGLYYYRARWYDARAGRFLGEDPIIVRRRQSNSYAYVDASPLVNVDPSGRNPAVVIAVCLADPPCAAALAGLTYLTAEAIRRLLNNPPVVNVGPIFCEDNASEAPDNADDRNPAQDKPLSDGDIRDLEEAGHDVHDLKGGKSTGKLDLYKDKKGNVYVKPKGGRGPGDPTGINLNNL